MQSDITKEPKKESKTISIKLPRVKLPSMQAMILILLIGVGTLQTAQLYGLSTKISSGQVNAASTTSSVTSSSSSSDSVTSSLPSMVGGC